MRYIRILCLPILLLLAGLPVLSDAPVRVVLGGRELVSALPVVQDDEVYVSPKLLEGFGASYSFTGSSDKLAVTSANGSSGDVHGKVIDGNLMLPISKIAETLDAVVDWDKSSGVVRLKAKLKSVEFVDGELKINTTLPVASSVTEWKTAGKAIVDIYGTKLDSEAKEVYVGTADVQRARLGQPSDDTARVVIDLNKSVRFRRTSDPIAAQTVVKFGYSKVSVSVGNSTGGTPQESGSTETVEPTGSLTGIIVEPVNDDKLLVKLNVTGKVVSETSFNDDPLSLIIELMKAQLVIPEDEIQVDHPLVKAIRIENSPAGFRIRVILNVNRYVAYNVDSSDGQIVVSVSLPKSAGGGMAGKTIVIDPGHGGRQTGTRAGGCSEKLLNLQIAKKVHRLLLDAGVNAVLTRDGDNSLTYDLGDDLKARPAVASKLGADMFISIHCNSGSASAKGTETYYHLNSTSGRALAQAIQSHIIKVTDMHNRRARSDGSVYPGKGFAVLRYATVPAVLIEAGYLSNYYDRVRLTDSDYQEKMARGIVNGIKAYIEGAP